jgi:hypothetical protein
VHVPLVSSLQNHMPMQRRLIVSKHKEKTCKNDVDLQTFCNSLLGKINSGLCLYTRNDGLMDNEGVCFRWIFLNKMFCILVIKIQKTPCGRWTNCNITRCSSWRIKFIEGEIGEYWTRIGTNHTNKFRNVSICCQKFYWWRYELNFSKFSILNKW